MARKQESFVFCIVAVLVCYLGSLSQCIEEPIQLRDVSDLSIETSSTKGEGNEDIQNLEDTETQSCDELREKMYKAKRKAWVIDAEDLRDDNTGLQKVIECMEPNSTLLFKSQTTIKPKESIEIKKPLTISGFHNKEVVAGEVYPKAEDKITLTCPSSTKGIFLIKSAGVLLANLKIANCSQQSGEAPVAVKRCNETSTAGVRLHHIEFFNNTRTKNSCALEVDDSANRCGKMMLFNVSFRQNVPAGEGSVMQLTSSTDMKYVNLTSNKGPRGTSEVVFFSPFGKAGGKNLTIHDLIVTDNRIPVFRVKSGFLEISNARFFDNKKYRKIGYEGVQEWSLFKLRGVTRASFRNCSFEDNMDQSAVMIFSKKVRLFEIQHSTFKNNRNIGSTIFMTNSSAKVTYCHFEKQHTNTSGAVFHLENSTATVETSVFLENVAQDRGGAFYLEKKSNLTIRDSKFLANGASLGGGCYGGANSNITISNTSFIKNEAFSDGGALHFERSEVNCTNAAFVENTALDQGGGCVFLDKSVIRWNNATFTNNKATHGGAIYLFQSNIYARNFKFRNNEAWNSGGCLNIAHGAVVFNDANFVNNSAIYGGVIFAQAFDMSLTNVNMSLNSGGVNGGALSVDKGNISLQNVTFVKNKSALGGALHIFSTNLTATELSLVKNNASEGSGLRCGESIIEISPREELTGTIPTTTSVPDGTSFGLFLHGNLALDGRGALDMDSTNASFSFGNFSDNRGPDGAALHFTSERMKINISYSVFCDNVANVGGGGIYGRSVKKETSLVLYNVNFTGGAASEGGALHLTSVNAEIENCSFVGITARSGGAVFLDKRARIALTSEITESYETSLSFTNCTFVNNTALVDGAAVFARGALEVQRDFISKQLNATDPKHSKKGFNVNFYAVLLENNRAKEHGGGVFMDGGRLSMNNVTIQYNLAEWGSGIHSVNIDGHISSCEILRNTAAWGGSGINLEDGSSVNISNTSLKYNKASRGNGGALRLSASDVKGVRLLFLQNKASSGGAIRVSTVEKQYLYGETNPFLDSVFLCSNCTFIKNSAKFVGGGLSIRSLKNDTPIVAQFQNCSFEGNQAGSFGGALHFMRVSKDQNCSNWTSCGKMIAAGCSFFENNATKGGRAIHSNDRGRILFDCRSTNSATFFPQFFTQAQVADFENNTKGFCPEWERDGEVNATTPLVSTYVRRVDVAVEWEWQQILENGTLLIENVVPGGRLPQISLDSYDEYNHSRAKSESESFSAELKSKNQNLFGVVRFLSDMSTGKGGFSGVKDPTSYSDFTGPYSYELEIAFNVHYLDGQSINVSFRSCDIGEVKTKGEVYCARCDSTEFNFDPITGSCKTCDENMNCSSHYVYPVSGFWHASPCHVPPKKCRTENACEKSETVLENIKTKNLTAIKAALERQTCEFTDEELDEYNTAQCRKGYKGVLCGSCETDYGRTSNFDCSECSSFWLHLVGLAGTCVWIIAITAVTIVGALQYREPPRVSQRLNAQISALQPQSPVSPNPMRFLHGRRQRAKKLKRSARKITRKAGSIAYRAHTFNTPEAREKARLMLERQCAQKRLCEILKIATNFLQAISIASVVNVNWRSYMLTMFSISSATGGSVSRLTSQAVQCMPLWTSSAAASIASLAAGFLIPVFIVVLYFLFFSFLALVLYECLYYLITRSILSALAVFYFSYLSISRVAVTGFGCVSVNTHSDFHDDSVHYYWVLDTSVKCFSFTHVWIMLFGALLFVFFTVGFPVISARILIYHRNWSERRKPQWIKDTMSFLYQAYDDQYVYWESVVMLRKAALSIIAVFSYHLSSNLLGLAATSLLTVCLYFQTLYNPYRAEFKSINRYERLSLLFSCIVFVLAQFFTQEGGDSYGKDFLSIVLIIIIGGFVIFMFHALISSFFSFAKAELSLVGTPVEEGTSCITVLKLWFHSKVDEVKDKLQSLGIMESSEEEGEEEETTSLI